jgi:hypothetical protein
VDSSEDEQPAKAGDGGVESWEAVDAPLPDFSRLSMNDHAKAGLPTATPTPPASKGGKLRRQEFGAITPVTLSKGRMQQSPSLSSYGVQLGDIREVMGMPPEDVLAHGVHLSGFRAGAPMDEKMAVAEPWVRAGAALR